VDDELGVSQQVRLAGTVVTRHVLQPGWSWLEHGQRVVGTPSCELYHRGVVLTGRMGVRTDEGEEVVIEPNHVFDLPPGHVTWVEGDDELVMVDWAGGAGFDPQPGRQSRVLATILFTDIVDSTGLARDAGDTSWKRTVAMHDDVIRSVVAGFGGREADTAGDSILVVFDSAEGAIRCGRALVGALVAIEPSVRSASTAVRWLRAATTCSGWPFTRRHASWPGPVGARCSCRARRAISPRAPPG
jgi:hypothetical protein